MKSIVKRYGMALFFLLFVIILMIFGTFAVKSFGDKMFEGTGIDMKPRGEHLN